MQELKEKYGDERRTDIIETEAGEFSDEDLIRNDEVVVTLTEKGYIKRLPSSTYRAQRRGGRGITGMTTREDDTVRHLLVAHSHDSLLFFTNRGRVFQLRVYELPDTGRTAKGEHLINLISIEQRERVTALVYVPKGVSRDFMIVATRKGEVKKTVMTEFEVVRRNGLIAMDLEDDDELIGAKLAHADDDVLMITAQGKAIRFTVEELRSASRTSGGVRGIRLAEGDRVVSLNLAPKDSELLIINENGYGKRTPIDEYPRHNRGGGGVITSNVTDKTGPVATARVITERDNDLMIISASGVVIRTDVTTIRRAGRVTQGVSVMNLGEGDKVVAVATTNGKKLDEPNGEVESNGDEGLADNGEVVDEEAAGRAGNQHRGGIIRVGEGEVTRATARVVLASYIVGATLAVALVISRSPWHATRSSPSTDHSTCCRTCRCPLPRRYTPPVRVRPRPSQRPCGLE